MENLRFQKIYNLEWTEVYKTEILASIKLLQLLDKSKEEEIIYKKNKLLIDFDLAQLDNIIYSINNLKEKIESETWKKEKFSINLFSISLLIKEKEIKEKLEKIAEQLWWKENIVIEILENYYHSEKELDIDFYFQNVIQNILNTYSEYNFAFDDITFGKNKDLFDLHNITNITKLFERSVKFELKKIEEIKFDTTISNNLDIKEVIQTIKWLNKFNKFNYVFEGIEDKKIITKLEEVWKIIWDKNIKIQWYLYHKTQKLI